ncbi:hypothetical protein C0J52_13991 [Blattella germanica]|nr:hypothetical protein C0J52_13991 [Blattella germanica]
MNSYNQDHSLGRCDQSTALKEALYDSLEEDNSDNFSSDSLECQKEKGDRVDRPLASEKYRLDNDSSAVKEKVKRISEKDPSSECYGETVPVMRTAVPFFKEEVTLTHIHNFREKILKARIKRTKANPAITNFTKQGKHNVKGISEKSNLVDRTDDNGAECFLNQWLIQANAYNTSQSRVESELKSKGTLCSLMKDLSLTRHPSRRRPVGSSCSEVEITFNKASELTAPFSYSSLQIGRNTKDHIYENKINCALKKEPVRYLQKYKESKYNLHNLGVRPPPEGSAGSTNGDISPTCLESVSSSCNFWKDNKCVNEFHSTSCKNKIIQNSNSSDTQSTSLCSWPKIRQKENSKALRKNISYKVLDFTTVPTLGCLGPELTVSKEKNAHSDKQKQLCVPSYSRQEVAVNESRKSPPDKRKETRENTATSGQFQSQLRKKYQKSECSVTIPRRKCGRKSNKTPDVECSSALLETLRKRHLEDVKKAEMIKNYLQ